MLFEPVLHESVADELRSAFPNWDGDTRKLDIRVPLSAQPFERTRLIVSIKGDESKTHELVVVSLRALFRGEGQLVIDRTDFKDEYIPFFVPIEQTLVEMMDELPRECITDDKFVETYSAMRRRPDGKSLGYIHDVVWQLAARFLIAYVCSQNEFEACFRRLEQSARTWRVSPTSMNYLNSFERRDLITLT